MLKIKILNISILTFVCLVLSVLSLSSELIFINKLYWILLFFISLSLLRYKFKFKSLFVGLFAVGALYIQFNLDQFVISDEFFLNCLAVLVIIKFSELKDKNNVLSFNLICMVIAIASLIKGQDILSTLTSITLIIAIVVNMYLIQQDEIADFKIKNLFKYLGFGLSIFPFIIIFYLIFPRAEFNFRVFDTPMSTLGIPDTINLGSFSEFSNSEEEVFILINNNYNKDELYFRVKVFDYINNNKSWRASSASFLNSKFKNSIKIKDSKNLNESYQIILEPYKKKWIPSLKNSKLTSGYREITKDYYNDIFIKNKLVDRKKQIEFQRYEMTYNLNNNLKNYYLAVPDNISKKIINWVKENNISNKEDFLNKIYSKFSDGSYYYNLTPQSSNNNYEEFFFNSKEGYCEYFASTFVLLSRLANIPSRIVSGYYGGELNEIGNFYKFKQKDTHAWAEVWLEEKGWVRIDPTKAIPEENVKDTLNTVLSSEDLPSYSLFSYSWVQKVNYFFSYIDFVWSRHLLSYNNDERKNFIKNIVNFNLSSNIFWIFAPIIFYFSLNLFFNLNSRNLMKLYLYWILLGKRKNLNILKSDTFKQILKKLPSSKRNKYKTFFDAFELERYSNKKIGLIKTLKLIF